MFSWSWVKLINWEVKSWKWSIRGYYGEGCQWPHVMMSSDTYILYHRGILWVIVLRISVPAPWTIWRWEMWLASVTLIIQSAIQRVWLPPIRVGLMTDTWYFRFGCHEIISNMLSLSNVIKKTESERRATKFLLYILFNTFKLVAFGGK